MTLLIFGIQLEIAQRHERTSLPMKLVITGWRDQSTTREKHRRKITSFFVNLPGEWPFFETILIKMKFRNVKPFVIFYFFNKYDNSAWYNHDVNSTLTTTSNTHKKVWHRIISWLSCYVYDMMVGELVIKKLWYV